MKIKIAITILFSCMAISAMEENNINNLNLNKILVKPISSIKLAAAWKIASSNIPVSEHQLPIEVLEYVNQIKSVLSCSILSAEEKIFLINIINNPEIDDQSFASLLKKYRYVLGQDNKQKILKWNHVAFHHQQTDRYTEANINA